MKKIILLLLFPFIASAQLISFSPKENISASDINANFQFLSNKINNIITFDDSPLNSFSQGEIIYSSLIQNNFSYLNSVFKEPLSLIPLSDSTTSKEFNENFSKIDHHIVDYIVASGGDEVFDYFDISNNLNYRVHVFKEVGIQEFNVEKLGLKEDGDKIQYLIVAGGASGSGSRYGGGGGAGGIIQNLTGEKHSISLGSHSVEVGNGGGVGELDWQRKHGENSSFLGLTAIGGGPGGTNGTNGLSGGSGGGGGGSGWGESRRSGGAGVSGQGSNGGRGRDGGSESAAGGGGGGYSSAGGAGSSSGVGGNGGNGFDASLYLGTNVGENGWFSGGGGGGSRPTSSNGTGGLGGGGGRNKLTGDGLPNTGGGGASPNSSGSRAGGIGGSGVVIIKYRIE